MHGLAFLCFATLASLVFALPAAANLVAAGDELVLGAPGSSWPAVAASKRSDGQFVVTWAEPPPTEAPLVVRGQRLDHQATPVGDPFLVADDDVFSWPLGVAVARDDSFVVAWLTGERLRMNVTARVFDATGTPRSTAFSPGVDPLVVNQRNPSVAADPSAGFVVVWEEGYESDYGYLGGNTRIAAKRIDEDGSPTGEQVAVAAGYVPDYYDGGFQAVRSPSLTAAGNGEFVVVWESVNDSYWYGDWSGVARTRLPRSGSPASLPALGRFEADGQGERFNGYPRAASDSFGNIAVVWSAASDCSSGSADYGEPEGCYRRYDGIGMYRLDLDDQPLPATSPVNVFDNEGQFHPDVAVSPAGDFVVVWTSGETPEPDKSPKTAPPQDGDRTGIFLRAFDCAGTPLSEEDVQVNQWTTGVQWSPRVAVSGSGHVLVTWSGGANDTISARAFRFDPPCPLCGDADASGEIRSRDALQALQTAVGSAACSQRRCDVDADGNVTTGDALAILIWSIGGEAKLRCDPSVPDVS